MRFRHLPTTSQADVTQNFEQLQPLIGEIQAASYPPKGAAGGALAGTYPNPTLSGLGTATQMQAGELELEWSPKGRQSKELTFATTFATGPLRVWFTPINAFIQCTQTLISGKNVSLLGYDVVGEREGKVKVHWLAIGH